MTTLSQEEENYIRLHLLMSVISPRAVRVLFDNEFHPSCLSASFKKAKKALRDLKNKRVINQSQWNLLFPSKDEPESNKFDITLMIALLTNLNKLHHYEQLPLNADNSPYIDLNKIKYYRNHISHNKDGKIDNSFFKIGWNEIKKAVGRLGGQDMIDECNKLETKRLDTSTVPWNIRFQIDTILERWKSDAGSFVETRAAKHVLQDVQRNSCVTITGSSGVGKTATLRYVALKMEDDGYDILPVICPKEIVEYFNPDKKTVFVIDDFCGTISLKHTDANSWDTFHERIEVLIKNKFTKIVVACRLQVYQDDKFEPLSIFRQNVCNLQSEDLCLSKTEKQSIAELYLDKKALEIMPFCGLFNFFPLLCKLYNTNPELDIAIFFQNPFSVYEQEINKLKKNGHLGKYCALALCVMFHNRLEEKWFTDEIESERRTIIENTCEACRLDRGTSRLVLLDEIKTLENTFLKEEQGIYKTLHDKIFDFLVAYFGQVMIQCLIMNADSWVIALRFLLKKQDNMDQFITIVPSKYHMMYKQRMIDDWSNERVHCVFTNINIYVPEFRQGFLSNLKSLNISVQEQLALTCDSIDGGSVLLMCCYFYDMPLIKWCLSQGIDVNKCDKSGVSPLFISSQEGAIEVVKILLDNGADTHKYRNDGGSPLHVACQKNYLNIVKLLLENKADVTKITNHGASPLYLACQNNCIEIVKMLLDKGADIEQSLKNGASPVCVACLGNHIDTVRILLVKNADINKCVNGGESPLYFACRENYLEIIMLLLENSANINMCNDEGASPLYIACQNNHKDAVNALLDHKADINKSIYDGTTPLSIACQLDHKDIVNILLDNRAEINKCLSDGESPVYFACQCNRIDILKILLDNNADINKCTNEGVSPLFIACQKNHIEIVNILVHKKADVNKCWNTGASPLYIACEKNNAEIVKILLDNKADINKCNDKGLSPLYIACQNNNSPAIVNVLLENKADINKCTHAERSPLFIACENKHTEIVKVLLDNKADINECDNKGVFPLYAACQFNRIEIVKILLEYKADINKLDVLNGITPLSIACHMNNIEVVKLLLDNKADIHECKAVSTKPVSFRFV